MSYFIDKYYTIFLVLLALNFCDANLWFASYVSNCYNLCFSVESCIIQCQNGFKSSYSRSNSPTVLNSRVPKPEKAATIETSGAIKSFSGLSDMIGDDSGDSNGINGRSSSGRSDSNTITFTSPKECGLKSRKHAAYTSATDVGGMQRIVGGEDAQPNEFPWIVSFQLRAADGKYKHFCAGAVINEKYVITAAHCLFKLVGQEKRIKLKAGINDYHNTGQVLSPVKFIIHDGWNEKKQLNDLALIRVKETIKYQTNPRNQYLVNSVCLNEDSKEPSGYVKLAGWGQLGEDEPTSDWLQKIDLPIWDRTKCAENYAQFMKITDSHICAGGKGGEDSCMGDSGGPLTQRRSAREYLIGVVSFGIPCAVKGLPGVYTHINKYIDWIKRTAV